MNAFSSKEHSLAFFMFNNSKEEFSLNIAGKVAEKKDFLCFQKTEVRESLKQDSCKSGFDM